MRFVLHLDDKTWSKVSRRLQRRGITGSPAEVIEVLLATALTEDPGSSDPTNTSTRILLLLGKIRVEQED